MRVNHGGFQITVPEQLLDCSNVRARLQQMGGEGMPECMAGHPLDDIGAIGSGSNGFAHGAGMNMLTVTVLRVTWIDRNRLRWKNKLPIEALY